MQNGMVDIVKWGHNKLCV